MPNEEENNTVDYSKFFKQEKKKPTIVPDSEDKEKSSFRGFGSFWAEADKKIKIEIVVLVAVVIAAAFVLIFYFTQSGPKVPELPTISPPEEGKVLVIDSMGR